jgi:hypothetical protein
VLARQRFAVLAPRMTGISDAIPTDDATAVAAISAAFTYLLDHGRAAECSALFTRNAKMTFGPGTPKPGTLDGIDAINGFLVARQGQTNVTTRHVVTNFRFTVAGEARVSAYSLLTLYRSQDATSPPNVSIVADINEIYVRQPDGKWLIEDRLVTPIFVRTI